jgi:hypothetical protein
MSQFIQFLSFAMGHWQEFLGALILVGVALVALLHALVIVFQMIPGPQPEGWLQIVADRFQSYIDNVAKYSKKPEGVEPPKT